LKPAPASRLRGALPHLLCSFVAHKIAVHEPFKNNEYNHKSAIIVIAVERKLGIKAKRHRVLGVVLPFFSYSQ
jgi:hypothetical protein